MSALHMEPAAQGAATTFDSHHGPIDLSAANIAVRKGWGVVPMILLAIVGVGLCALTLGWGLAGGHDEAGHERGQHAIYAYHVGVMAIITFSLGGLALTMIWRAFKAGWSVTLRRQSENIGMLIPIGAALLIPYAFFPARVWHWMDPTHDGGELLAAKRWWLNPTFLAVRLVLYVVIWTFFAARLYRLSRRQDQTGDKMITNRAQWLSMPGLLSFALCSAFFAFDLIMGLDYHWFSTMFGVYFFAGSALSGTALVVLITAMLRAGGKLKGMVTSEHYHDLGKMLSAFTIFWAYIAFSQYFLIWYANIPEETAWFMVRRQNGWDAFFLVMIFGHFLLPFVLLLFRKSKRVLPLLVMLSTWQIVMHLIDLFWQIRPVAFQAVDTGNPLASGKVGFGWVDITGVLGPICIWVAGLLWIIPRSPLIPTRDPRLAEALNHKNYV